MTTTGVTAAVDMIDLGQDFLGQIVRIDAMRPKPGQNSVTEPRFAVILRNRTVDIRHCHFRNLLGPNLCLAHSTHDYPEDCNG